MGLAAILAAQPPVEDIIRVSVNLVQIDAVVTDASGHQVADLKKEECELFQDGRPQPITHFSYIAAAGAGRTAILRNPGLTPPATAPVRARDGRRIIALVADDLGLSFVSTAHVRDTLRKFVDRQMLPQDFVAVFKTSGAGALNQYTNDKRMLHAAIDGIQWSMMSRAGAEPVPGLGPDGIVSPGKQMASSLGTFRALRFILDGLRKMPGRKTLILFSDGIHLPKPMREKPGEISMRPEIERAADSANRSAVVIHGVDARGLLTLTLEARDNVAASEPEDVVAALDDRREKFQENRNGLYALASLTGGTIQADNNDLSAGVAKALQDSEGYYLIGFQPGEDAFRKLKGEGPYHRLTLRVKRPGLRVRYHRGYIGTEERPGPAPRGSIAETLAALESPFAAAGVRVRLTPVVASAGKSSLVNVLVHIDGRDLTFAPGADGWSRATIHLIATTWGDRPKPEDSTQANYTIRAKGQGLQRMQTVGLIYNLRHTVKKAGAYHLRVAVRDAGSRRVGTASQFIEVPDLSRGALALSGIMLSGGDIRDHVAGDTELQQQREAVNQGILADSALRVFRPNVPITYLVSVFNAPAGAKTGDLDVEIRARLFRDGKEVWAGKPFPAVLPKGFDARRVPAGGVLTPGKQLTAGEYWLQVTAARPGRTGQKAAGATAWIDIQLQ